MTTKKINWRLKGLPTTDELRELVKDQILTKEEAREILFSQEDEEERDKKSLETEIRFLRDLVTKLSTNRTQIVETIKEVYVPYKRYPWYQPYEIWATGGVITTTAGGTGTMYLSTDNSNSTFTASAGNASLGDFSTIKTF